jgi:NTE family protein
MLPAELVGLIARTAMFAHLDEVQRTSLARQLRWLCLPGGQSLFRPGEPADALYLLCSGSLGVFDGPTRLLHQVAAGECVGEMSLLSGGPHRHAVRALRDSELLRLDRPAFEALIERHPGAMLAVARLAVERLLGRRQLGETPGKPRTFALLPVDATVPARALAERLAQALRPYGRCVLVDEAAAAGHGSGWFAEREAEARFTIYLDERGDPVWRRRCLRQADVLLLPAHAAEPARPWPEATPGHPSRAQHRPRHLILLHPGAAVLPGAARRWRAQFSGELQHHHVRSDEDVARVARLASGHGRGLVLAGGGARGLAHLGALKALREAGRHYDAVGGTSIGAIIGAGVALQWDTDTLLRTCREAFVRGHPVSDWTLPLVALTRGRRASAMLRRVFGATDIEDLPRPFFCVSTDLTREARRVHRRGPLWLWLRASSAIPGLLPPVLHHGDVYVDGALMDNLPTDVMADDGLAHITAVSIRADSRLRTRLDASATPPWWRLLLQRRDGHGWPGLVSTLTRAAMVNSEETSARCRALADLLVTPPLEHIGILDWQDFDRAVEAGYRETVKVLEAQRG